MKRQDIESLLRTGFEKTVPDVVGSVLEQCGEQKGSVIIMTEKGKKRTATSAAATRSRHPERYGGGSELSGSYRRTRRVCCGL